jgi:hypothetical protein
MHPIFLKNFSNILTRGMHCEASTILVFPNGMKFSQYLHMSKSPIASKFQLNPINYVSTTSSFAFLYSVMSCTASASYIHPNELKICKDDHLGMRSLLAKEQSLSLGQSSSLHSKNLGVPVDSRKLCSPQWVLCSFLSSLAFFDE